MRLSVIGGKQYAFELEWKNLGSESSTTVAKRYAEDGGRWLYGSHQSAYPEAPIMGGFGELDESEKLPKKPVYSYAMALANVADDGIYVAPVDDSLDGESGFWYVVVILNSVMPGTDTCVPADKAGEVLGNLSLAEELPIYSMGPIDGVSSEYFDPEAIVAESKVEPLKLLTTGIPKSRLVAIGAIALIAIGAGWVYSQHRAQVAIEQQSAEANEQQKAMYLGQLQMLSSSLPADAFWLRDTVVQAYQSFPAHHAGWDLIDVNCVPTGCEASYKPLPTGFSFNSLKSAYPEGAVRWDTEASIVRVSVPSAKQWAMQVWDEQMLLSPDTDQPPVIEVMGAIPTLSAGIAAVETSVNLKGQYNGPIDAQGLAHEVIKTTGEFYLDPLMLPGMTNFFATSGFVATSVKVSRLSSTTTPKWEVEWARLKGIPNV